jgi:hypothetical protein
MRISECAHVQACDMSLGRVRADASCSNGYLCCDETCATDAAAPSLQVL